VEYFNYIDSDLYCEDVCLATLAKKFGTPLYVYSRSAFESFLGHLNEPFSKHKHLLCYSVKSASNISLLNIVAGLGLGADVVSGGELYRALRASIDPQKIVYSGVGKKASEMAEALDASILMFNVESKEELELLSRVARDKGLVAPVALRVNPDVDPKTHPYVATGLKESKFGIPIEEAPELYQLMGRLSHLKPVGLDCHIGSQLVSTSPFMAAVERLKKLLSTLRTLGIELQYLDLGGGLGIRYNEEIPPTPAQYAQAILEALGEEGDLTIILEPGRSAIGNAAVLLVEVLYNKTTPSNHFVVIDGAMNDLIRPSLYGSYHQIVPLYDFSRPTHKVSLVGPICESGDFLAKDRLLPQTLPGEFLAVKSAGAYGFSMSSNYNSRGRAAEVLVERDSYKLIRERETYSDLIRGEYSN
jgi:diaminopimelate decarboxylase